MIWRALPASSNTGGTASRSRVGSSSAEAGLCGQAKVCTCTMTGSAALFCSVTTPVASPAARSTRVGATLSEAAVRRQWQQGHQQGGEGEPRHRCRAQKVSVMLTVSV